MPSHAFRAAFSTMVALGGDVQDQRPASIAIFALASGRGLWHIYTTNLAWEWLPRSYVTLARICGAAAFIPTCHAYLTPASAGC